MTTDRREILRLYHLALAQEADARRAFLAEACAGDDEVRREVELLLAQEPPADFLETAALNTGGTPVAESEDTLIGQRIGAYRIDSRLGSGGMGDVFRATDTTLGRAVAVKMLPPAFAHDHERRTRLEREARALALLNHAHIAQVYGLEMARVTTRGAGATGHALVMELVKGETLTHLLSQGRLPVDQALRYGVQIADALAAAHAHGIVHRDVKPANVMVGESGIKVLDFGLAKLSETAGDDRGRATAQQGGSTQPHQVLGTVAYMSPEQIEGRPVDVRSDVFSLGVLLYEMLCGQRPFARETAIATLAATLEATPQRPRTVRKEISVEIERILLRCLEKRPEARYASAREVHQALHAHLASRSAGSLSRRTVLVAAAVVVLFAAVGVGVQSYVQSSRLRWVEQEAVPEASRLINENRKLAAQAIYRTAERYAPPPRVLFPLAEGVATQPISFVTTPPGARVYISDYAAGAGEDLSQWQLLGVAPLTVDTIPRWGYYRVRAVKEGFASAERTYFPISRLPVEIRLHEQNAASPGMVWIPPASVPLNFFFAAPPVKLPGFWMDRYEVTNRQFKAFVDAGGYQKEEFWKEPFVRDGRALPWREAVDGFRDTTGRPGPAGWLLGTYPEGAGDIPVSGVSWYEAAAYAAFAGKSLPTVYEWFGVLALNVNSDILKLSNFSGQGPEPVGTNRGMASFGAYDMAGNVKEWVANPAGSDRFLLGGSWAEEDFVLMAPDPRAPFSRDKTFGLRCVRRTIAPPDETLGSIPVTAVPPRPAPVDDATFQRFLDLHAYDKTDLEARVERVDDTSPFWRRETVTLRAAYDNERVIAHLFLPKNAAPPFQIVAIQGGSTITSVRRLEDFEYPFQFLVRAGRAVIVPAYSGTLERGPTSFDLSLNQERQRALRWSMDLGRSLDYVETRSDIDIQKLGFYGVSSGGTHGVRFVAVDQRFKTAVLVSTALFVTPHPAETDPWHFAPRVRVPVLIQNGRDDVIPYETAQRPLFDALGTKDKVFRRYSGGHASPVTRPDLIGEILDWFDKHLGPVNQARN